MKASNLYVIIPAMLKSTLTNSYVIKYFVNSLQKCFIHYYWEISKLKLTKFLTSGTLTSKINLKIIFLI